MKIYDPKKGYSVNVGEVIGNIFHKNVIRAKHYFRLVSGYGIQAEVFEALKKQGIKTIVIKEEDTGDILTSELIDWTEHLGKGNWGHGRQYVLSEKYMEKRNVS